MDAGVFVGQTRKLNVNGGAQAGRKAAFLRNAHRALLIFFISKIIQRALFQLISVSYPAMPIPLPNFRLQLPAEKPAIVQMVTREDMIWNRPIFRAPPLRINAPAVDAAEFPLVAPVTNFTESR